MLDPFDHLGATRARHLNSAARIAGGLGDVHVVVGGRYVRPRRGEAPDPLVCLADGFAKLGAASLEYIRPQYFRPHEAPAFDGRVIVLTRGLHRYSGRLSDHYERTHDAVRVVVDLPVFRWLEPPVGSPRWDKYVSLALGATSALPGIIPDRLSPAAAGNPVHFLGPIGEDLPAPRLEEPGPDAPVLVLLQVPGDTAHGVSKEEYDAAVRRMLERVRAATDRPIAVRRHPNYPGHQPPGLEGVTVAHGAEPLEEAIARSAWCVTWNSSAAWAAIRAGVPVAFLAYGDDATPPAWDVCVERYLLAASTNVRLGRLADPLEAAGVLELALRGPEFAAVDTDDAADAASSRPAPPPALPGGAESTEGPHALDSTTASDAGAEARDDAPSAPAGDPEPDAQPATPPRRRRRRTA